MAEITKLGRYQIKGVLGRGAMGVVYEGLDPALNRRVAIKTILKNAAIDAETAQMYSAQFAREAQAAGRLTHPNIVGVHDFAEEGEVAYLVMEFIQGRELRSFFDKKEKFEVAEAVRIMGELLDALDFAHEAGVIHRDVKPANVMLDAQRRVKLADFGVARIQDSERSAAGTMVGTPAFMSPEQIQGMKIDRRTDIFSAGVVLYQLLTGEQPFTGAGAWTVAKKIMQDDPPQPSTVVQSVSPVFDAIVNKALAKKASDRFASAKEFAAVLRGALGAPQPSAMVSMPPMPALPAQAPKAMPQASETELEFWKAIQNSTDAAEFEFYLEQFPQGTYAALARHKIARLSSAPVADGQDTVRLAAEAAARRKAEEEEKARQEAEAKARQEAVEQARRAAAEKAKREAEEKAKREAETRARVEAELKAKREADEKARQAQALAKLKQQEEAAARARTTIDEDATIAIPQPARTAGAASPARPVQPARPAQPAPQAAAAEPPRKSFLVPAIVGAVVVVAGAGAFFAFKPASAPVAVAPSPAPAPAAVPAAPAQPAPPVVDEAKIRREVEERIRREYADKSAAEQSAAAKVASEKAIQEKKTAAKAATEKQAADRAAAEKAAADKAMAEKLAAAKSAGEKAALERIAAEKAAADAAAAAAAEKAAAEKAAADKAAADRAAAERAAAERQVASVNVDAQLEKFIQRKGAHKVMPKEPPFTFSAMNQGEIVYVNDGTCPRGMIKEVQADMRRQRTRRCISLE